MYCMAKKISKIVIIFPAFNEEKHIDNFSSKITAYIRSQLHDKKNMEFSQFSLDCILVDDGSTDATAKIAQKYSCYVISHLTNLGKGAALKTGCEFAFNHLHADYVIMMDADEQHSPIDLPHFVEKIKDQHDIILGVRSFTGMPIFPILFNKLASVLVKVLYGTYIPDIPSGYKAISKKAYEDLKWIASGYEVEIEIAQKIAQKKLPFTTVSIQTIYPQYVRGMTPLDGIKVILRMFGLR